METMNDHLDAEPNTTFYSSDYYKIENPVPRYLWAAYFSAIFILSIVGDGTILVSSCLYKAIKLQKLLVVVIEFMALSDLLVSFIVVLPRVGSLIVNRYVLGDQRLCHFFGVVRYVLAYIFNINMCFMTGLKLLILKFPLRASTWPKKRAVIACVANIVLSSLLFLLAYPIHHKKYDTPTYFNYEFYSCDAIQDSSEKTAFFLIVGFILIVAMPIFVIFCTVWLLLLARKISRGRRASQSEQLKWQGVTTTISLAVIFCLIDGGYVVYYLNRANFDKDQRGILVRVVVSGFFLNVINNIFIYFLTISSFREFVKSYLKRLCLLLGCRVGQENSARSQLQMVNRAANTRSVLHVQIARATVR